MMITKSNPKLIKLKKKIEEIENILKEKKSKYMDKIETKVVSEIKENPKVFYNYARKKSVIRTGIGALKDSKGVTHYDDEMKAELLKIQYESVASTPRENIRDLEFLKDILSPITNQSPILEDIWIDPSEVESFIKKLKNDAALGPDGVPNLLIKKGGQILVDAIVDIARTSIEEGDLPEILKLGWITPIWKKNVLDDPSDYRPISLTSHIGKLIEKLVRQVMSNYLIANNLIETEQHGSRNGRSTLTQLLSQHDQIVDKLAQGYNCDLTYLDFSKAYDLVDHSILLRKLKAKGFHGKVLKWIQGFLSERKQVVRVKNTLSGNSNVILGVLH